MKKKADEDFAAMLAAKYGPGSQYEKECTEWQRQHRPRIVPRPEAIEARMKELGMYNGEDLTGCYQI